MVACYAVSCNNTLLFNIKFKKVMHYIQNLEKIPFLKVLKDCSDDYEPSPQIIVTSGQLRVLKQRDKCTYLHLYFSSYSLIEKEENTKNVFLGVNYV